MENNDTGFPMLPQGLSLALAQNPAAFSRFVSLSANERQALIERTHQVHSKDEMQRLVAELSGGPMRG